MSILSAIPIVGKVVEKGLGIIDKLVKDKDLAAQLKKELESEMLSISRDELEAQSRIVLGEIQGESWLQRNWRPIFMLAGVAIVVNNYILFPYLSLFSVKAIILELPDWLYQLLKIGMGGYVVGRSAEKIAKTKWGK